MQFTHGLVIVESATGAQNWLWLRGRSFCVALYTQVRQLVTYTCVRSTTNQNEELRCQSQRREHSSKGRQRAEARAPAESKGNLHSGCTAVFQNTHTVVVFHGTRIVLLL